MKPYGYQIVNAKAVPDEEAAEKLRKLYREYLKTGSIKAAGREAGIEKTHSMLGLMLKNKIYLGTCFYPRLVDDDTFARVQQLRTAVSSRLGRTHKRKAKENLPVFFHYEVGSIEKKYQDPYRQARYAYEQIREVRDAG